MEKEIINRVAQSKLKVIDLEDYYPEGQRFLFDIKDWLYEGLVLREKDFRNYIKEYDWSKHQDQYVALSCTTDAIIPAWAYMLLTVSLKPIAKKVCIGNLEMLETLLYQDLIQDLDVEPFLDKPVIIKGCANKPVPVNAYTMLTERLKPYAKSIMYGEACSSVPLYKKG
ncbi:DUF2480 family protein [Psychroserpens sp.]|uniref:DUF2480 family protein n=1 Tax=Psychroserpens sp. TaxID=2020870 RepID=UPI001B244FAB|nr:DUF2480 family protein [Psychroserpens sp.]MBO6605208.1 DUF2480 family protein [Psychroserpens sp.]MBO6630158.1 DUF2480 family protein [Psychroserpens sp.]MBO6653983.1 DUF2480 family protein [Psychroserpens sp.]MBO6682304.1 DUF2480 family protein [Psychroserpens sp.]MBO6748582.1 DUF2480 family protein [Psychroserpens sp.]